MDSEEKAVSSFVNLAEEAKLVNSPASTLALLSICMSLVAGGVAGGVSRTAVAPLELLKILLQVQNPHNIKYNGTAHGLKYIWRTEGFRGLFKGNGITALESSQSQQSSSSAMSKLPTVHHIDKSSFVLLCLQTDKSPYQYRGMVHALSTDLREEGPRALYKGWLPSVIGVVPYVGLNFAVYESLKDWLINSRPFGLVDNSELSVTTRLACGAFAGTIGQTVAYPLDVIRRRMQMVGWKDAASVVTGDGRKAAPEYTGMVDALRKTVQYEGFRALYKGLVPNSVKVVPSIAIAFVTYEVVKDILGIEIIISD